MDKSKLKRIVSDQLENFQAKKNLIPRIYDTNIIKTKKISVITGIRRSGKSTLLRIISQKINNYGFINFEDERLLDFSHNDFNSLLEIFYEIKGDGVDTFFFDEIQNIYGWEKFVSRLYNDEKKIFITGSNSKLLSSELSSSITGRHIANNLFPFSFLEYLNYHKFQLKKNYTTKEIAKIKKYFNKYLKYGGFPEVIISLDIDELKQLYQDIIIKDIIVRHGLKETKVFRELAHYLLSNICTNYSYNNLSRLLNIKSAMSVKNYIGYLEDAFLFISIPKFDYSVKKQIKNDRKIYVIDTGLYNAIAFSFSENRGKILENFVLTELYRRKLEVFYHKQKYECDFLIRNGNKITTALQVTADFSDIKTKDREIRGLLEAMESYNLSNGLILTYDQELEDIKIGKRKIRILPVWKWVLD